MSLEKDTLSANERKERYIKGDVLPTGVVRSDRNVWRSVQKGRALWKCRKYAEKQSQKNTIEFLRVFAYNG